MRPGTLDHLPDLVETVSVRGKEMEVVPISLSHGEYAWSQSQLVDEVVRQYNAGLPVRIIVLKARQLGTSTISAAVMFLWMHLFPGSSGMVIAHDTETTQALFEKVQAAWEWWALAGLRHLRHSSMRRLTVAETGSTMRIATARNLKSGRGLTLQALHCSEMSFWEDPETLMSGLINALSRKHGTIGIIECTANGVGNLFWKMWTEAVAGRSDYVALFFPWWKHPEYMAEWTDLDRRDLDEYELWLVDELWEQMDEREKFHRIEWRRWAIVNLCSGNESTFQQEFPAVPDEAFLRTGRNVFPLERLQQCFGPAPSKTGYLVPTGSGYRFEPDAMGELRIFQWPSKDREWGRYFVAADPSRTAIGDPACIQVVNRRTYEQVAVWHGHKDPIAIAEDVMRIGHYYNDAIVCSEVEGPGYATIGAILQAGYPWVWQHRWADKHPGKLGVTYGWSTNSQRKHWMMQTVVHLLSDRSLLIHDEETYAQMRDFSVISEYGEMGHASKDGHDDAVMAYAQAVICTVLEDMNLAPVDLRPGPRRPPPIVDLGGSPPWEEYNLGDSGRV